MRTALATDYVIRPVNTRSRCKDSSTRIIEIGVALGELLLATWPSTCRASRAATVRLSVPYYGASPRRFRSPRSPENCADEARDASIPMLRLIVDKDGRAHPRRRTPRQRQRSALETGSAPHAASRGARQISYTGRAVTDVVVCWTFSDGLPRRDAAGACARCGRLPALPSTRPASIRGATVTPPPWPWAAAGRKEGMSCRYRGLERAEETPACPAGWTAAGGRRCSDASSRLKRGSYLHARINGPHALPSVIRREHP